MASQPAAAAATAAAPQSAQQTAEVRTSQRRSVSRLHSCGRFYSVVLFLLLQAEVGGPAAFRRTPSIMAALAATLPDQPHGVHGQASTDAQGGELFKINVRAGSDVTVTEWLSYLPACPPASRFV